MSDKLHATLKVSRGAQGEEPRFDSYDVPFEEGASILDALVWVRVNQDASLAFRYSCFNANACKECMVRVDGKIEYACTARLKAGIVTVEPLPKKRLVRDLVTDIVPPKERLGGVED